MKDYDYDVMYQGFIYFGVGGGGTQRTGLFNSEARCYEETLRLFEMFEKVAPSEHHKPIRYDVREVRK